MKRSFATMATAAITMLMPGCWEAEADQDTMGDLQKAVTGLPLDIKLAMSKWAANRVAYGYLLRYRDENSFIGTLRCESKKGDQFYDVSANSVMTCLREMQTTSYVECLNIVVSHIEEENIDDGWNCMWESFAKQEFNPKYIPSEFEAERITPDHITEALIGAPPPPKEIQLMLLGLRGFAGPHGFLCVQGVDWACAPGPFESEPSASASSGGGDR